MKEVKNKVMESLIKKFGVKGDLLLFVGRLSEKKGVNYLIKAMPEIVKKFPKTKLLIIGDGEERKSLMNLAKDLGLLKKNIIFTGFFCRRHRLCFALPQ